MNNTVLIVTGTFYKDIAKNVVDNATAMADEFLGLGYNLVSGGTKSS